MNKENKEMCMYEEHYFNHKTNKWEKNLDNSAEPTRRALSERLSDNSVEPTRRALSDRLSDNTSSASGGNNTASGGQRRVCVDKNCTRRHKYKRSDKLCPLNGKCPDIGVSCFLLHDLNQVVHMCKYGKNCCDLKCGYRHPQGRQTQICPKNETCPDALITCFLLHDLSNIIPLCRYNKDCINFMCDKRHSRERIPPCPDGSMCYNYILQTTLGRSDVVSASGGFKSIKEYQRCPFLHPKILQRICKWDLHSECRTYGCSFVHKPTSAKDCPNGMQCQFRICEDERFQCTDKHPKFHSVMRIGDKFVFE